MQPATQAATILLALVAVVHLLRLVFAVDIAVGGLAIPLWASLAGVLVPGALAPGIWREHRSSQAP